jgi:TfoX/Sxy family transcriptional regulator of competence genes
MPYSKNLDDRIRAMVADWGATRKAMFGGTCNLVNGNMMCGVYKDFLILRLGEEHAAEALRQSHTKPFDITGRPMKGWIMVEQSGLSDAALKRWLQKAKDFVESLPPK